MLRESSEKQISERQEGTSNRTSYRRVFLAEQTACVRPQGGKEHSGFKSLTGDLCGKSTK